MASKSSYLISGLAVVAVMIVALPAAKGIGASTRESPLVQVNRAAKGNRLVQPMTIAVRKPPVTLPREPISMREPTNPQTTPQAKPEKIMDGCEPSFSPVVVPAMAHLPGRCVS
jgi:hypothetical protein